jgi:hypothetical protein
MPRLAACDGREEGEVVTVLQDMVRGPVLAIDDLEEPDRPGDLKDMNDIINRRQGGQFEHLFIRAEGPQGREQFDLHLHTAIIPDIPTSSLLPPAIAS